MDGCVGGMDAWWASTRMGVSWTGGWGRAYIGYGRMIGPLEVCMYGRMGVWAYLPTYLPTPHSVGLCARRVKGGGSGPRAGGACVALHVARCSSLDAVVRRRRAVGLLPNGRAPTPRRVGLPQCRFDCAVARCRSRLCRRPSPVARRAMIHHRRARVVSTPPVTTISTAQRCALLFACRDIRSPALAPAHVIYWLIPFTFPDCFFPSFFLFPSHNFAPNAPSGTTHASRPAS